MERKKIAGYPAVEGIPAKIFPETQVIVQNGTETQLRVTLNNNTSGVVEVEFQEMYETPFHYPLQRV
jgi:hypothetical protein